MTNLVLIKPVQKVQKLQTKRQQDLIEMIGYIYLSQNEYNLDDMAKEMKKSKRTIHRMIADINSFYPLINKTISEDEKKAFLSITNCCREEYLDGLYQKLQNAPVLYLFLIMLFHRPLSCQEIMKKLNLKSRTKAMKIAGSILDTSYIIDCDFKQEDVVVGNWKFIY